MLTHVMKNTINTKTIFLEKRIEFRLQRSFTSTWIEIVHLYKHPPSALLLEIRNHIL